MAGPNLSGPRILVLLLLSSLLLNFYFYYQYHIFISSKAELGQPGLGWGRRAAAEAEAVAAISCSGHGRAFLDSLVVNDAPVCECNTCYAGPDCSELLPDCSADLNSGPHRVGPPPVGPTIIKQFTTHGEGCEEKVRGDPVFLEPYWKQHASSSAVMVSGWHRMTYQATGDSYISLELEKHVRLLHRAVGNAVTDGRFIVLGTGSTQLINALVYALSPDGTNASVSPARVVASVPYYPVYRTQTELFDSRQNEWEGVTSEWINASNESFIEFVTSPNNPDGRLQRAVLGGPSVIYDHCYYWPHYTAIPAPADEDVMMFSISKISGHASSRFGWALLKDEKVYEKALFYMNLNTMGVSRDTQLRILKIIKAILPEIRGGEDDIFKFGFKTMRERWKRLNKLISSQKRFSLQKLDTQYCTYLQKIRDPSPAYAWLKCEREEDRNCEAALRNEGIISRSGVIFEADSRYTRLSLIKTQDDFEQLMKKMEAVVAKEGHNSV